MRSVVILLIFFLFFSPSFIHASVVNRSSTSAMSGLLGYWTLDGASINWASGIASDVSGQGKNGALLSMSTTTSPTSGKIGQGLLFDGINDRIITSTISVPASNTYTQSFWLKTTQVMTAANYWKPFSWGFARQAVMYGAGVNHKIACINDGSYFDGAISSTNVDDLKWHHIVCVNNGNSITVYVDGVSESTNGSTLTTTAAQVWLGSEADSTLNFPGILDDVRLYGRALSASEVAKLYTFGNQAFLGNTSKPSSVTPGLVGYWTFDGVDMVNGTVRDKSGRGNTGNLISISTTTFYTAGKIGQGLKFDGVNDAINAGSASSLDDIALQGGGGMTVAFWIKSGSNSTCTILSKGAASDGSGFWNIAKSSLTSPARLVFQKDGSSDALVFFNNQLTPGEWTHVALTWNGSIVVSGGNLNLYRNGAIQTANASDGASINSDASNDLYMGSSNGSASFCDVVLDDTRIYNKILTAAEISKIYTLGNQGVKQNVTRTDRLKEGLVGYWTFDGKDMPGGRANDVSGQGNTGYLTSIATTTFYSVGKIGQGAAFNGVDSTGSHVKLPTAPTLTLPYTISMWFNPKTTSKSGGLVGMNSNHFVMFNGTSLEYDAASSGTFRAFCNKTFTSADLNKWWHVVWVINSNSDASQWQCYLNNVAGNSSPNSTGTYSDPANTNWTIGQYATLSNRFFPGSIDDVRVYSRALSASEVATLYNLGN